MSETEPQSRHAPSSSDGTGWHWGAAAAATFCISIWGAVPLVTKFAAEDFDAEIVGVLRTVFCLPLVAVILLGRRRPWPREAAAWGGLALTGITTFIGFPVLFSWGQALTTASHGGLIIATAPILTGIVSAVWHRHMPGKAWGLGAVLGFAGVAALIFVRADDIASTHAPSLTGDLMILAGVLAAAVGYVSGARLTKTMGSGTVTYWANVIASLLLLPWAVWYLGSQDLAGVRWEAWASIIYLAAFAQVVNFVLWYWAMDRGGIARIAAFQFVQPVITLVLAVIFLGEIMTLPLLASAALILFGTGLCQFKR
ncbi:MAG: DMT family transporter [Rhodospirillales bacterium]